LILALSEDVPHYCHGADHDHDGDEENEPDGKAGLAAGADDAERDSAPGEGE